jgi:hypothetical protein
LLTLGILIVCLLQVLHDTVLADNVLDLALGLDIEGVLVEQGDLVLALALRLFGLTLPHGVCISPAGGVVDGGGEFGVALAQFIHLLRVVEHQLSHALWIGLLGPAWLLRVPVRSRGGAHHHGHHLAIPYAGILQCLSVGRYRLAVQVQAL